MANGADLHEQAKREAEEHNTLQLARKEDLDRLSLGQKQRAFSLMVALLISHAYELGYEITFGDAFRDPRVHGPYAEKVGYSHPKSVHKLKLAIDLNLFKNGRYLRSTKAHKPLGVFWESLGGAWGGRWDDGARS